MNYGQFEANVQQIAQERMEHGRAVVNEDIQVLDPLFTATLGQDWKSLTGLDIVALENLVFALLPLHRARPVKGLLASHEILLAILYCRLGKYDYSLLGPLHLKKDALKRAVAAGLKTIAESPVQLLIPRLELPTFSELFPDHLMNPRINVARFIIDGRHQRYSGAKIDIHHTKYFSYKYHAYALSQLFVVNLTGFCVAVSNSMPAATHDITLYREHKKDLFTQLGQVQARNGVGTPIYLMADRGFISQEDPEICTNLGLGNQDKIIFDSRRVVIEQFFGRMTGSYELMRLPFKGKAAFFEMAVNACYRLTNLSIAYHPLRLADAVILQVSDENIEHVSEEKRSRHRLSQRTYRLRRRLQEEGEERLDHWLRRPNPAGEIARALLRSHAPEEILANFITSGCSRRQIVALLNDAEERQRNLGN